MGPCFVSIFQYISNKMQRYTAYLYLETALHVSGGTSTQHQERIQLYLQHKIDTRKNGSINRTVLEDATNTKSHGNQRLHVQWWKAPDDGHNSVRNM
jgi:hypothetical protein